MNQNERHGDTVLYHLTGKVSAINTITPQGGDDGFLKEKLPQLIGVSVQTAF